MRTLLAGSLAAAALSFALAGAPALAADADPTVDQIYQAARAGHLDQAQQMMDQVLRDHPTSSKAHYVQAELYAHEGNPGLARSELARAEQLDPGLPKENPRAVQELKAELGLVRRSGGDRPFVTGAAPAARFPWGTVLILALVVGVFWMLFRRRTYTQYPAGVAPMGGAGPGGYGPGGYGGPGGGGYGPGGGGIGSSVAGGLAGGLAAGAGIVAGEELAHHFLDGGQHPVAPLPSEDGSGNQNANSDMGGNDFGVNDPGSWDDSSGGGGGDFGGDGGGGGDGWT
jgi:uncharacterized protein